MKRFRITAALSLALTLLPAGVFADEPETAPLPATSAEETTVPAEEATATEAVTSPVLDLVFCIDVSGSMKGAMPVVKATILSLIKRTAQKYPGSTIRLGLVRYGDGAKRYFILDLGEDQKRFLRNLQDTKSDAVATEFVGDVVKKSVKELTWSENSVRKIYVIGNETALQGPVAVTDATKLAREKSITVSAVYCDFTRGFSQGSDVLDVRNWFGNEWDVKKTWIDTARLGGGEYMQIVSYKGNIVPINDPLLAVAWEPETALRFADYLSGPASLTRADNELAEANSERLIERVQQLRMQRDIRSLGVSKPVRFVSTTNRPVEAGVVRYYEKNPKDATFLIRP